MGYKDDGKEKFWVITLYYQHSQSAVSDAELLAKRLNSYMFNTFMPAQGSSQYTKRTPLTDRYEVGRPEVQQYKDGGATLSVECRFKTETRSSSWLLPLLSGYPYRDILFLAPDPAPYISKK
jgi:hypothetical protein